MKSVSRLKDQVKRATSPDQPRCAKWGRYLYALSLILTEHGLYHYKSDYVSHACKVPVVSRKNAS